jgi:lysophospholipase L1-like esterase
MTDRQPSRIQAYLVNWGFCAAGLVFFVATLFLYESWESRVVFGRWSQAYAMFLAAALIALVCFLVVTWRSCLRAPPQLTPPARLSFGISVAFWGLAYFLTGLRSPLDAGRVTDLNVIGSTVPVAAVLEWFALCAFVLAVGLLVGKHVSKSLQNTAVMIGTVVVFILVGEGGARAWAIAFPRVDGAPTYTSQLWYRRHVQINSQGYRDVEHRERKDSGVRRLLLVGDSFTFGTGIDNPNDRIGEQLIARLNADNEADWELVNGGVPDTHTRQHVAALQRLLAFDPDLVVLLYVFNDLDYLAPVTSRPATLSGGSGLNKLHPGRVLFLNSYLYQQLYVHARKLAAAGGNGEDPYLNEELMNAHVTDLRGFIDLAESAGVPAAVVPFDLFFSEQSATRYGLFVAALRRQGLTVCSLDGAFGSHSFQELRVNALDGHPNELANRLAADAALTCLKTTLARSAVSE